jgi:putative inorganic carbon (hco3(-)) transporter
VALARGGWIQPLVLAAAAAALTGAGMLLAYSSGPIILLVAVAALAVVALALANPLAAVLVAITLIPLEIVSVAVGGDAGISPAEGVFALAGFGWVARRLMAGLPPYVDSPLTKPLAVLLLVAVVGLGASENAGETLRIIVMWTAAFFVVQLVVDEAKPATVGWILLLLAVTGGIVAVITSVTSGGQEQEIVGMGAEATGRAAGSFGHPNLLAVFLAAALAAAGAVMVGGRPQFRPVAAASFVAALAGLALTLSRGGLLAAGAAVAVMLMWRPFRRMALVALVVGGVALLISGADVLGSTQSVDLVTKRLESVQYASQADPRSELWRGTPEIIGDHPFVGVGAGQFSTASAAYGLRDPFSEYQPFEHAHSIPLTVAAELGLLGLAAFLWFAVALGVVLVRSCRRSQGWARAYAFGLTAALVAVAVQGLVDYTVRSNVVAMLVLTLAASAVVLSRASPERPAGP